MQFAKCSFSTRKRFQMPLRMISADPVAKVTRLGSPKRETIAGERVIVQLSLRRKFVTITM